MAITIKNDIITITNTSEEKIELKRLENERADLQGRIDEKEPTKEELLEYARKHHPYYFRDIENYEKRIGQIDEILKEVK